MAVAALQSDLTSRLLQCRYVTEGSFRASHRVEQSPEGQPRWASTLPGMHTFLQTITIAYLSCAEREGAELLSALILQQRRASSRHWHQLPLWIWVVRGSMQSVMVWRLMR